MGSRGAGSGREGAGAEYNKMLKNVQDAPDYRSFFNANKNNPEFMKFGREYGTAGAQDLWRAKRAEAEKQDLHEMSQAEAVDVLRGAVSQSALDGWFREANSSYKPAVIDSILTTKGGLNAAYNVAYHNYKAETKNPMSFDKWLKTPQTMYRGDVGQKTVEGDIFTSFTPNKKVAESFGSHITTLKIRPIDTWGSAQTTGEQEFMLPTPKRKKA